MVPKSKRAKAKPKYQSKQNQNLKWSGRGMLPVSMRDEMKGTKLTKEDFRDPLGRLTPALYLMHRDHSSWRHSLQRSSRVDFEVCRQGLGSKLLCSHLIEKVVLI